MSKFIMMRRQVSNRGRPPEAFLQELVDWARDPRAAPDWLFVANTYRDVYSTTALELGPWRGISHRRAAMVEVLRVLAGFESSWDWERGVDTTNPASDTPETEETGAWQVSADSMRFDRSLREYVKLNLGTDEPHVFIKGMKAKHQFAIGYIARLLRFTVAHNGPVRDLKINPCLSRAAVREAERLIGEGTEV